MKIIDKLLKKLNTDRNTFATYIFTLITIYLAVDRIVEMLLMIFTGVSYSYWGPVAYTFALACPMLAFAFSPSSKFSKNKPQKNLKKKKQMLFCHQKKTKIHFICYFIIYYSSFNVYTMAKYGSMAIVTFCTKLH